MDRDDTLAADTVPTISGDGLTGGGTNRYSFGDIIGRGGMGEVFKARDAQIGRTVAVKRLKATSAEAVARFMREAQVQGRLEHPAIVPVHELGHDDRGPFFVMKQLAGVTMADGKHDRQRLLRAFVDVCLCIEFAHTRGVVHRDLKPANIVLGEFGEVYVLDWGIARVIGDTDTWGDSVSGNETQVGAVIGTPGYMSPEQCGGEEVDARADVYALGCILFEILAGKALHPRGTAGLASAIAGVEIELPGEPPELVKACCEALAPLEERTPSARALGDAVQRYLDGDRDLEARRHLALDAMTEARAASDPRIAARAASRALALDSASREAAELLGRLMLEPPKETPPEVEHELRQMDIAAVDAARPLMTWAAYSYFIGIAALYLLGLHDLVFSICGALVSLAMVAAAKWWSGQKIVIAAVGGNVIMLAWLSRLVSPFLLVPGIAVVLIMATVSHVRFVRMTTVVALSILALLAPLVLEHLGWVRTTMLVHGGEVGLVTESPALPALGTQIALSVIICMMFVTAGLVARNEARTRLAAQRAVQIQKWQLDQLVPR